ncbi:hypothetical protein [Marinicella litoralis]|uniref:Lipoprotein n=1 Tax=Marinicella litoralis TaxID=644220 RepID=A0A4R6XS21_9GAMM|nr:hypothetical protein [Marinicella litoralis]TDR20737.1 hypothetical protein C8D91_1715 [Marinicella litoralis]
MKLPALLTMLLFGLIACQPKGSLMYQFPEPQNYAVDQVMVVIDYLNLKDDIGKLWDFDSYYHQQILNKLLADVDRQLHQSGYPKINKYLLSSGLLIKDTFAVEHYIEDQIQDELLYPPFILAAENIATEQIDKHQEILTIMVKYIAPRRHQLNDELTHRGMQMGYHFEAMQMPANTAILYIHIDQSAPGILKQMGTFLISGALASQADYGHVSLGLNTQRHASAFFIHSSGQILWKNHSNTWSTDQPINQLLNRFPEQF